MIFICNIDPFQFIVVTMENIWRNVIEIVVSSVLYIPVVIKVSSGGAIFFTNRTLKFPTISSCILFPSVRRLYMIIQSFYMNKWNVTISTNKTSTCK